MGFKPNADGTSLFFTGIIQLAGDVTNPTEGPDGNKLVIQCCNSIGAYGAGVSGAIANKWPRVEIEYRKWATDPKLAATFKLGHVQFVPVEEKITVVNMIGQKGVGPDRNGDPPIRYDAIAMCLEKVAQKAIEDNATIHAPMFGAGLAGGDWSKITELIEKHIVSKGKSVYVYNYVVPVKG